MPRKKTARIATIQPSVIAAFFGAGALNAATPFEIASVPVIATHPSANPRRMQKRQREAGDPERLACACRHRIAVRAPAAPMPAQAVDTDPTPISASIIAMKTYVGTLNAMPDSRTPRRLTTMSSTIGGDAQRAPCAARARDTRT